MRKFQPVLFLLLFTALFCTTACTGDGNESGGVVLKHNDNTVRVRQSSAIKTLNPYLYRFTSESVAIELVYQYLMNFDPATLEMAPELAIAPPVVEALTEGPYAGGKKFTYEIQEGAVWEDGKPVTGHDYAFILKVLFNPKTPTQRYLSYLDYIRDVQVDPDNPRKFSVLTNREYLIDKEALSTLILLPEHIYDPNGLMKDFTVAQLTDEKKLAAIADDPRLQQFADQYTSPEYSREVVSGSGAYELVEWIEDQRIVLAKKENWWGDALADRYTMLEANPDTIILLPISDQTAAITALKDEAVDIAFELDSKQFKELQENDYVKERFDLYTPPRFVYFYTALNNRNSKLADKRVRRALAHLIDMNEVIDNLYDGFGERMVGPFFPDKKYYNKDLKPIEMDLDKARELLKEAGWEDTNGNGIVDKKIDGQLTELSLSYLYVPASTFQDNFTQIFKANAQKVGIEIEREGVEGNMMGQRLRSGDYEIGGLGAGAQPVPDDPKQLWHTDGAVPGGSNYSRFGDAESDALIEAIRNAKSEAERNKLYLQFQQLIYDEQPVIFQLVPTEKIAVSKRFDVIDSRKTPGISLQHVKLKQAQ